MRTEKEPATPWPDDADGAFEGVVIEPIKPDEQASRGPTRSAPAPHWSKRLTTKGKLARALVVTLMVIVAVIVVLSQTTFTLPPQITRLLTPAPTQTPTPGRLITGASETVPFPVVPNATANAVVPSPHDASIAYACMNPSQTASGGGPASGEISLWITHDAGQSWSRAPLPDVIGTSCAVESAIDGSRRVVMSASNDALDQNAQACAHSRFFLSEDDGATWRSVTHTSLAPAVSQYGGCFLQATARHLFLQTSAGNNSDQGRSILERSDDGGKTWLRADHGLEALRISWFAQPLDATGERLFTFITNYGGVILTQSDFWISQDAGTSWRRVDSVALPAPPTGGQPISNILIEPPLVDGRRMCHCVFGVSYPEGNTTSPVGEHLYYSHDLAHWTPLPPLPVKGTSAQRSGVYETLGITADGRLLALGAEPEAGMPSQPVSTRQVSGGALALWAWDTHSERWDVAPAMGIPCADPQSCYVYVTGVSVVTDFNGKSQGAWFWIGYQLDISQDGASTQIYSRVYIPS
jgi:hypothetical protein